MGIYERSRRRYTRVKSGRKSNRVKSRRKSNRVKSRRKKIKSDRRYSRNVDVKTDNKKNTPKSKKLSTGQKVDVKTANKKDTPKSKKKKLSTGQKVGIAVGATAAGAAGIAIGGGVMVHKAVVNSPQYKELTEISKLPEGSQEEADAVKKHLENESQRLEEAMKKGSLESKQKALYMDQIKSSASKTQVLEDKRAKALAANNEEEAKRLSQQIDKVNKSTAEEIDRIGSITTDEELSEYAASRRTLIQKKLDNLGDSVAKRAAKEEASSVANKEAGSAANEEANFLAQADSVSAEASKQAGKVGAEEAGALEGEEAEKVGTSFFEHLL